MAVRHVGDAEKDVEQRGLAASRRAEYGDDLPILDGKIDILEHDMRAIRLLDVPQFEHGTPSRFLASSRPPRRYCPARPQAPGETSMKASHACERIRKRGAMSIGAARESIAAARESIDAARESIAATRGPIATVRTSIAAAREAPTAARPDQLLRRCASHRRRQRTRRRTARLLHGAHVILVDGDLGHRLGIRLDNQAREALLDL